MQLFCCVMHFEQFTDIGTYQHKFRSFCAIFLLTYALGAIIIPDYLKNSKDSLIA